MTNAIAIFLSVGGWHLWNVILASTYSPTNKIYYVRHSLFHYFGRSFPWWLTLILIVASVMIFEFGVDALRAAFLTSDEDVFQALEKDPGVKRRFEEAAAEELQQGWDRKTNKERDELERVRAVMDGLERAAEERREGEVREMLRLRVEGAEEGDQPRKSTVVVGAAEGGDAEREDPDRLLERGFGRVRKN
jgi:phospholipid-translocating ATPase